MRLARQFQLLNKSSSSLWRNVDYSWLPCVVFVVLGETQSGWSLLLVGLYLAPRRSGKIQHPCDAYHLVPIWNFSNGQQYGTFLVLWLRALIAYLCRCPHDSFGFMMPSTLSVSFSLSFSCPQEMPSPLLSVSHLLPGPLAKLAADNPIKCLPAWLPEKPRVIPKSRPRFCALFCLSTISSSSIKIKNLLYLNNRILTPDLTGAQR